MKNFRTYANYVQQMRRKRQFSADKTKPTHNETGHIQLQSSQVSV